MQSAGQKFSTEHHPFSIAVLTSPDRRRFRRPQLLPAAADVVTDKDTEVTLPPLSVVTALDGPAFPPPTSPVSSTGSADCSPDTSFGSAASSVAHSSPELPILLPVSRACSPAASEDSGRGSPVPLPVDAGSDRQSEKPPHSYIALISMAILASDDRKLVLSDIYQYIMDNFPFYNNQERAWRNSIRHNLSLNECFIKAGRADNGKGNFWAVHPACVEDFSKGDFRRRQARRRARATASVDQMTAAALAMRCASYVPMTTTAYHPYLMGGGVGAVPACFPSYLPTSYSSFYPAASLGAPPLTTATTTAPTTTTLPAHLALSDHTSLHTASSTASPAPSALMAAYTSWCSGAPPTAGHIAPHTGGQLAPSTVGQLVPSTAGQMAPLPAGSLPSSRTTAAFAYSQQRYSPYARLPTQLMW